MARQEIDTTTNHGTYIGDPLPIAFEKVNSNDEELYLAVFDPTSGLAATKAIADAAKQGADAAYKKNNILGTVGQSGGVPTGAIIQQGSGATGRYVRYADGTQICYGQTSFTMQNGTSSWQVLYAATFATPTAASVQIVAGNSLSRKMGTENIDTTNCAGFYENLAGATAAVLHYIAVGRWY